MQLFRGSINPKATMCVPFLDFPIIQSYLGDPCPDHITPFYATMSLF